MKAKTIALLALTTSALVLSAPVDEETPALLVPGAICFDGQGADSVANNPNSRYSVVSERLSESASASAESFAKMFSDPKSGDYFVRLTDRYDSSVHVADDGVVTVLHRTPLMQRINGINYVSNKHVYVLTNLRFDGENSCARHDFRETAVLANAGPVQFKAKFVFALHEDRVHLWVRALLLLIVAFPNLPLLYRPSIAKFPAVRHRTSTKCAGPS